MSDDQEEELETYVSRFVKFSLCFFNFLMWIFGLFLISIGIWATVEEQRYSTGTSSAARAYVDISIGIIIVGIIVFLIPLVGFLGAIRENVILLRIFGVIIGIIVGVEVLIVILLFVFWDRLMALLDLLIKKTVAGYQDDIDFRFILDFLQDLLNCCGASGYRDWDMNIYFNCSSTNPSLQRCAVPYSCCKTNYRITNTIENYMCGFGAQTLTVVTASSRIYTKGCVQALTDTFRQNAYTIGGILIAIALCQIASFIMSDYMISRIKKFCKDCDAGTVKKRRPRR